MDEIFGFVALIALVILIAVAVLSSRLHPALKFLIVAGLFLRVVGSWVRHLVLFNVYAGSGDARVYFRGGRAYADRMLQGDFSMFVNQAEWFKNVWWGTQFVYFPSGLVATVIGPSLQGAFLAFSLLSFLGLIGFAVAFRRSYPDVPLSKYVRWIWLFPSLWYWPSSVGKEAILLMGLGVAMWGFIGKRGRINWPLLMIGVFFVFAIRPQVAAVFLLSLVLSHWLSVGGRWTFKKVAQGVAILAVGLFGISQSMESIGVDGLDVEGVQTYMEGKSGSGIKGGSGIGEVGVGVYAVPLALINILFRPFPWEAHNTMSLISSVEIWFFWAFVWWRRRQLVQTLRHWRSDRFLSMAVPFILIYAATLGMVIANLGIIARQRIFLFPFLFLLLEAAPALSRKAAAKRQRATQPRPIPALPHPQPARISPRPQLARKSR